MKQLSLIPAFILIFCAWSFSGLMAQDCCAPQGLRLGVALGTPMVSGQVRALPRVGALAINLEKPLNNRLSLRYQILGVDARGQDWRPSADANSPKYRNYRNLMLDQSLQLVVSLTDPGAGVRVYATAGVGGVFYHAETDLLHGAGHLYSYESVSDPVSYSDRRDVLDALEVLQDGHFETPLNGDPLASGYGQDVRLRPSLLAGLGVDVPLGKRLDLSLAYRISWHDDAFLDGYGNGRSGMPVQGSDLLHAPTLGITYNLGKRNCTLPSTENPTEEPVSRAPVQQDEPPHIEQRLASLEASFINLETKVDQQVAFADDLEANQNVQQEAIEALQAKVSERPASPATEIVRNLYFETGESRITSAHYAALAQVSAFLEADPGRRLEVRGFADAEGSPEANLKLSESRAKAAAAFLSGTFGVARERIVTVAMGAVTDSPAGAVQAVNRRVTLRVAP